MGVSVFPLEEALFRLRSYLSVSVPNRDIQHPSRMDNGAAMMVDAIIKSSKTKDREISDLKRKLSDSIAREQEIGRKLKECRAHADALAGALEDIQWKSADKDNMEFTARITCYQQDRIRNALTAYRKYKEPGE